MRSNLDCEQASRTPYGVGGFDYRQAFHCTNHSHSADFFCRSDRYPHPRHGKHPMDCSVMQYTGHEVLRTLIRCHFSPAETTGSQYIYSGSANGKIHVCLVRVMSAEAPYTHLALDMVSRWQNSSGTGSLKDIAHDFRSIWGGP